MPTIKRYKLRYGLRSLNDLNHKDVAPIFRAMQITDNNHHTLKDFMGAENVRTETKTKKVSKSRTITYEKVMVKTRWGWRVAIKGQYVARLLDGRFEKLTYYLFEAWTQETEELINA